MDRPRSGDRDPGAGLPDNEEPRGDRRLPLGRRADCLAPRRGDQSGAAEDADRERKEDVRSAMNIRSITAPNPGPYTLDGTRTYLLDETAVIDPGPSVRSHVKAIAEAMPNLRTIFITHRHPDHAPAALPLKKRTGARIVAPR